MPLNAWRAKHPPGVYEGSGKDLVIGYFIGCGIDIVQQKSGNATLQLLRKTGRQVHVLDNCCCGLPARSFGDLPVAQNLAKKNLETVSSGQYDVIVTDCSSCASFLKTYPSLFSEEDSLFEAATQFSTGIRDLTEWLDIARVPTAAAGQALRVTYHDPCHAARGQRLVKEPREALKKIPEIEYIELPEADWCCGGAGAYALSQFDLYRQVLDRKIGNVKATGADIIATSCPACIIHLSYGVRKHGLTTRVCHISEIVNGDTRTLMRRK